VFFFPIKKRFFLVWELDPTGVQQEESQEKENPDVAFWLAHDTGNSFLYSCMYITCCLQLVGGENLN
jgi:hypothetical protein